MVNGTELEVSSLEEKKKVSVIFKAVNATYVINIPDKMLPYPHLFNSGISVMEATNCSSIEFEASSTKENPCQVLYLVKNS